MKKFFGMVWVMMLLFGMTGTANALTVFTQGFETDTAGWEAYNSSVTQVASGTDEVASSEGSYHAVLGSASGAPYTKFDGYRDTWEGGFSASVDIYLDTSWAAGSGFDYSVAASGSDGEHQRDYIFHVAKDTSSDSLLVGGSNNTNFATREDLDNLDNSYAVATTGWYTFQHVFYDYEGALAVDLNLIDSSGTVLFTETRFNASDLIPDEVGGNRYGWFTFIDVEGGLNIDNVQLDVGPDPVPEPSTIILLCAGLIGMGVWRKKQ